MWGRARGGATTWGCGRAPRRRWRAVIDPDGVADLLVARLDCGEVEHDDDAAVLHGVADELVQPDDAELLKLPPQHPALTCPVWLEWTRPARLGGGRGARAGGRCDGGGGGVGPRVPAPCPSSC